LTRIRKNKRVLVKGFAVRRGQELGELIVSSEIVLVAVKPGY